MKKYKKQDPQKTRLYTLRYRNKLNKSKGGKPCPLCGYYCLSLGSHVFYAHGITAKEYRMENGYTLKHTLTTPELHKFFVEQGKLRGNRKHLRPRRKGVKGYYSAEQKEMNRKHMIENLKKYRPLGQTSEMAKARIKKYGHPMKGLHLSKETKDKISKTLKAHFKKSKAL